MTQAVHSRWSGVREQSIERTPFETLSQKVLQTVRSRWFVWGNSALQNEISSLPPTDLKRLVDHIILDIHLDEIDRLAEMLPLEVVQEAIRTEYPQHVNALETAKAMFHEAKYFVEITQHKISPGLRTRLVAIFNSLISILESVLKAFGIADFFKAPENATDSEFKAQKIMMLLGLFSMISTLLIPLTGAQLGGMILGSTFLSIAILSLIYPHFKPASSTLPRAKNWSQEFREGTLFAADGRKSTLDEIAHTLIVSKTAKTHVMLIGKTGVGKTETAKAFVQAVERGDYPELQGKEIHYINTAELLLPTEMFSNGNKIFSQISEAMGRQRENYILIFDEIHMACQTHESVALSEQLKTLLDPGRENFPYVIGITTEEEYFSKIYVNNAAFARRFKRIAIENTEDQETLTILGDFLLKQAPAAILKQGTLQHILNETKDKFGGKAPQPATSLKILSQSINRIAGSQRSPSEIEREKIETGIQAIYSRNAIEQGKGLLPYGRKTEEILALEEKLRTLEIALAAEKEALDRLDQDRKRLGEVKAATYKAALKIGNITRPSTKETTLLNAFLLQSHFMATKLEARIQAEGERLKVKTVIDPELIDQVITEEIENDKKAQEAVNRGKAQIEARSA